MRRDVNGLPNRNSILVPRLLSASGHVHGLLDGQGVGLSDRRLTIELPPDGAVVPAEKTGEPGLPTRGTFVVERDGDEPQVGAGHAADFRALFRLARSALTLSTSGAK